MICRFTSPVRRVGQKQVDGEELPVGQKHHPDCRRDSATEKRCSGPVAFAGDDRAGRRSPGGPWRSSAGVVGGVELGVPVAHQTVGTEPQHPSMAGSMSRRRAGRAQQLADRLIAPVPAHRPAARGHSGRGSSGGPPAAGRRAGCLWRYPRWRPASTWRSGVDRAQREVLRHPLDEPQREAAVAAGSAPSCGPAAAGDVVLERVGQLVPDDVVQVAEGPASGQHDPPPEGFGDPAGSLADIPPTALVCWNCGALA